VRARVSRVKGNRAGPKAGLRSTPGIKTMPGVVPHFLPHIFEALVEPAWEIIDLVDLEETLLPW
jgi:hypothetical protein